MLLDTGCSSSVMPEERARKLGLSLRRQRVRKFSKIADGSVSPMDFMAILTMRLGPTYTCTLKLDLTVGHLEPYDMLLGMEWMRSVNPKINFKPLSLKIADKHGRSWEIVGMRPPGSPHYCSNHGYQCEDKGRGVSYGAPSGLRTGGGGLGHRSPLGGFGQAIPVFRHEDVDIYRLPCTCGNVENGERKWIDWRDLFPDREWYTLAGNPKNEPNIAATETLKLLQDEKDKLAQSCVHKTKESLGPRTMPNTKGIMPSVKTKRRRESYDLFR